MNSYYCYYFLNTQLFIKMTRSLKIAIRKYIGTILEHSYIVVRFKFLPSQIYLKDIYSICLSSFNYNSGRNIRVSKKALKVRARVIIWPKTEFLNDLSN